METVIETEEDCFGKVRKKDCRFVGIEERPCMGVHVGFSYREHGVPVFQAYL